jgi:8-oxo-dGTP pyrophosphatase MutT (NUDIX family)
MIVVSKTKFLEFKFTKSPAGHDWYYVKRTNDTKDHDSAVVITTIVKKNDDWYFLFLKTQRPPLYGEQKADYCIESPAGLIGDNDTAEKLLECAGKELKEEVGLVAEKLFVDLQNSATSAGLSSETVSYVTAIVSDDKQIEKPVSDGGIITDRFFVKTNDIGNFISQTNQKKVSIASATISGIYFALGHI